MIEASGYYERQRKTLVKNHAKMMEVGRPVVTARYGDEVARVAVRESAVEFERLIPDIPYIGGRENPLTDTLVQMTSMLALYRALKAQAKPVAEIGEIVYEMEQRWTEQLPALGLNLQRQGTIAQGCTHCDFRFGNHK